ncbi:hypothetical protein M758_10G031600 [Ceratodon purpureus]|nr:hypothetical protein M758_10G031600 [Ceratodon purpureus]
MPLFQLTKGFAGPYPWEKQYFENSTVPNDETVSIDDALSWVLYPKHRWVYNKMLICETQGLAHGPHSTTPDRYPVFSKPIYNMNGMGTGSRVIANEKEYVKAIEPGYFWMPLFEGRHVSTDVALEKGTPRWWQHSTAVPGEQGTFDYFMVHREGDAELEEYLTGWITQHLQGFSGVINVETIGRRIIECHLRMTSQWVDLNGEGWLDAVANLHVHGVWRFENSPKRDGFSVALFGEHGKRWSIDREAAQALLPAEDVTSIQVTFDDSVAPDDHYMPEGGFRLAVINCWDLEAGKRMRETLRSMFVAEDPAATKKSSSLANGNGHIAKVQSEVVMSNGVHLQIGGMVDRS